MRLVKALVVALALLLAPDAWAAMFRAASFVYVPVAAAIPGLNNASWRTDLEIQNVDSVPVDVMIVLLPSGGFSNSNWFQTFTNHLGGRSEDGFTKVEAKLKDIQPGRAVVIQDVVRAPWNDAFPNGVKGALLIWAFEAGSFKSTTPFGGRPKKIVVTSHTYTLSKDASNNDSTFGQTVPGLPWYDYIDPHQRTRGLDRVTFTGIREDAQYRTAIGLVNVSDRLTTLEVRLTLNAADGTLLKDLSVSMPPLSHRQFDSAVRTFFVLSTTDFPSLADATVTVSVPLWQSSSADPTPALLAYVSKVDNRTNDPIYYEQRWSVELPWQCIYEGQNCPVASAASTRRPEKTWMEPPTP